MNPYIILDLHVGCSEEEITIAYRKKAKECHPDVGGDAAAFSILAAAVGILRDPRKRKLFDEFGIIMDMHEDTIQRKVNTIFSELVSAWIDRQLMQEEDINISVFFEKGYAQTIRKLDNSIANSEKQLRYLKKRKENVISKDPENKVKHIIEAKMNSLSSSMKAMEEEKYIFTLVKELCGQYESVEEEQISKRSMFFSTPTSPDDFIRRMMTQTYGV